MADLPSAKRRSALIVTTEGYGLCFVDENCWAYFANVPPQEMSGDDWNDAPHDCNASQPYPREGQKVVKVAFEGPYEMVGGSYGPKDWDGRWGRWLAADAINRGEAPWLADPGYGETYPEPKDTIMAGVSLSEFRKRMRAAGGEVYEVRR